MSVKSCTGNFCADAEHSVMLGRNFNRRQFFLGTAASVAAATFATKTGRAATARAVYYLPGYTVEAAWFRGRPLRDHAAFMAPVPPGYEGLLTMVTRLDEAAGSVRRALFPIAGHQIAVSPTGGPAVLANMNGDRLEAFDPESLESLATASQKADGFMGGGHAAFTADGAAVLVTERRPWAAYSGRVEDHFGRITVREPTTLRILDRLSCFGLAPHEVNLLADGRHIAVSNYGRSDMDGAGLPNVIEPSLTIIEIASGKLVDKIVSSDKRFEVRHIAAHSRDRMFAIQGRLTPFSRGQLDMLDWPEVYEPDQISAGEGYSYVPAPALHYRLAGENAKARPVATEDATLMRYGQSIVYDPVHDEAIGTFPTRHCVIVFDGERGTVKRVIRTDRLGLRHPRGIALHPDGRRYAVSGYWSDLFVFNRGTHLLDRPACQYETFFGHSHLTAASH